MLAVPALASACAWVIAVHACPERTAAESTARCACNDATVTATPTAMSAFHDLITGPLPFFSKSSGHSTVFIEFAERKFTSKKSLLRHPVHVASANVRDRDLGHHRAQPVGHLVHARLLGHVVPENDPAFGHAQRCRVHHVLGAVERPFDLALLAADHHIDIRRVHRWCGHPGTRGNPADLCVRITHDANRVVATTLLDPRGELAKGRLRDDEPMRVRRSLHRWIEANFARRAGKREVRPLAVHMIVDPEHHDVVCGHEVDLRLVDEGVGFRNLRVIRIVPVGVLVRNDHVEAALAGPGDRLERTHERRRDAGDDGVRSAELESIAGGRVIPGNTLHGHHSFDAVDDLAGGERGHYTGLQYGSPAEMNRTGTSGAIVLSHSAQTCIPGASLTTRPMEMKPFFTPANATSWA